MILDLIFPPLCLACKERCRTKFLCPDCWTLSALPDPIERCRHCFQELDTQENFCVQCRKKKLLPVMRAFVFERQAPARFLGLEESDAMAGFAYVQWIALGWPDPDAIIPMPDSNSIQIGLALAKLLDCPFVRAIRSNFEYREESLEEEGELLLFDAGAKIELLKQGALALSESFPKRIRLLSLYEVSS